MMSGVEEPQQALRVLIRRSNGHDEDVTGDVAVTEPNPEGMTTVRLNGVLLGPGDELILQGTVSVEG